MRRFAMSFVPKSIVAWFGLCWVLILVASVAVALQLVALYQRTTVEQGRRAEASVARGCDAIAARYAFVTTGTDELADPRAPSVRNALLPAVQLALRDLPGVEGGLWQAGTGSLAYAYPTYDGSGEKTDLPQAEEGRIRDVAELAARDEMQVLRRLEGRSQLLLLAACPLPGPIAHLAAWTMTRVATVGGEAFVQALLGVAVLSAVLVGSAGLLGALLLQWSRQVRRVELALAAGDGDLPQLASTGQRDLDRVVAAINGASDRLLQAQHDVAVAMHRAGEAERLASVGRMTAGVAHEIRNPIGAMRLKAENALASGRLDRALAALQSILGQIERLDGLLRNLLSASHAGVPLQERVRLKPFLAERTALFRETAEAAGLQLEAATTVPEAVLDKVRTAQAIDNLVLNAIQATAPGGIVRLTTDRSGDTLVLSVSDTGRGVPEELRETLFDPFVSGRADGSGLGLAIVRDVALAQGGQVEALHRMDGTTIRMELPWRAC